MNVSNQVDKLKIIHPKLEKLNIKDCKDVEEVIIEDLPELKTFTIKDCKDVQAVIIQDLPKLEKLEIQDCKDVQEVIIQDLPKLKQFTTQDCANFTILRIKNMTKLLIIDVKDIMLQDLEMENLPLFYSLFCFQFDYLEKIKLKKVPLITIIDLKAVKTTLNDIDIDDLDGLKHIAFPLYNQCCESLLNHRFSIEGLSQLQSVSFLDYNTLSTKDKFDLDQIVVAYYDKNKQYIDVLEIK